MTGQVDRRTYHSLDAMRGIAAIFVVARHIGYALKPIAFPNSFIAVDLFFVLSGFVIAAAYDERLASGQLTAFRFIVLRYIRLWPLYVLAAIFSLLILRSQIVHGKSDVSLASLRAHVPFALLMLPSAPTADISPALNTAWTLFFELLINILYAVGFRWLGVRQLLAIIALSAIGIVAASLSSTTLDSGWAWQTSWVGFVRVCYSFPVGILLYRYHAQLPPIATSAWLVLAGLAVLLAFGTPLAFTVAELTNAFYLDLAVLILLPALVAVAVNSEPQPGWTGTFKLLGVTSYAIYVLHPPLLVCIDWFADKLRIKYGHWVPQSGLIILVLIFCGAYLADRFYDKPVRAWLTAWFNKLTARRLHQRENARKVRASR